MGIFDTLKSYIAISLLFLYISSTTEFHELLKVPVLIGHFMEHRSENKDLSFWDFIFMHYAQGQVKDADYDKDMRLPFKSLPELTCSIPMMAVIPGLQHSEVKLFLLKERMRNYRKDLFITADFSSYIWQPPKYS